MPSQWTVDRGLVRKLSTYFIRKPANCGARIYGSDAFTHNKTGTWLPLIFDTEREDTGWITDDGGTTVGFWRNDGNAFWEQKLFAQKAGWHTVVGHITWAANAAGIRGIAIRLDGATYIAANNQLSNGANNLVQMSVPTIYWLEVGDYVELMAYQSSGGNLNILSAGNYSPEFAIVRTP